MTTKLLLIATLNNKYNFELDASYILYFKNKHSTHRISKFPGEECPLVTPQNSLLQQSLAPKSKTSSAVPVQSLQLSFLVRV